MPQMMEMSEESKAPKDFHIRVLTDGTFVMSSGSDEYGYDSIEELLSDLESDLTSASGGSDDSDTLKKKKKVKQIMEDEDEEME